MKTAFVCSGGGAKGAFEVGVIKNLVKNQGILPDRIYGTSTGSLQAAGYAHIGIDRLEALWRSLTKTSDIMGLNWLQFLSLGFLVDGIYNLKPLRAKLEALAAEAREPGITCDAVVTKVSLLTGELKYCYYDDPDFIDSVVASCSTPLLNSPVGGEWVDGGVRDQIPIDGAINDGYDRIICIITNPYTNGLAGSWSMPKIFQAPQILIRTTNDILSSQVWLHDFLKIQAYQKAGMNIQVYMPDQLVIQTDQFNAVNIAAAIDQGYKAQPIDLTKIVIPT